MGACDYGWSASSAQRVFKPFASVAGIADSLDWTVPRDTAGFVYDLLAAMDGDTLPAIDPDAPYYDPIP